MIRKLALRLFFIIAALSLTGCFDYEEKIVLFSDYSGYIDILYTVPLYENEDRSLISSYPVRKEQVMDKFISKGADELKMESFSFKRLPPDRQDSFFHHRGTVSLRLRFERPSNLEHVLFGKTTIQRQGSSLKIRRVFPVNRSIADDAGRFVKSFQSKIYETFQGRNVKCTLMFPWYFDLVTNQGTFLSPGVHFFQLPLTNTLDGNSPIIWNVKLKANPIPQEAP